MKKFKVIADVVTSYEIEVEAQDKAEAEHKANKADMNDWYAIQDSGFDIILVEELKNDNV